MNTEADNNGATRFYGKQPSLPMGWKPGTCPMCFQPKKVCQSTGEEQPDNVQGTNEGDR